MNWSYAALILFAYLTGSLISAVIVAWSLKLPDPRKNGSNNPGTTNMLRLYGKKIAVLTLSGDVLKTALPVILANILQMPVSVIAATGAAAIIGHLFPVFYHFQGGKGVASLIGVLSAIDIRLGLVFIITWLLTAYLSRYSSLAAIVATILTPVYAWFIVMPTYGFVFGFISILILWRHRGNIYRLINQQEKKLLW